MDFITHLEKYLSKDDINNLLTSLEKNRVTSFILNTNKLTKDKLISLFPNIKEYKDLPNCFTYSKDEYDLGKSYLFNNGVIYIMDISSQLVPHYLDLNDNDLVLDMCSAPGGKTICLALKNPTCQILANDLSFERAKILSSNIEKIGVKNVTVISNDFSKNSKEFIGKFDKILLDAPCSGSAMFRKQEDVKKDWTYEKVVKLSAIQKELLEHAYIMLKNGGEIMYSTCSFSYEEDEEVILDFLSKHKDMETVSIPPLKGFYSSEILKDSVHIFPHLFESEGQFFCKLKKKGVGNPTDFKINKKIKKENIKELEQYNLSFNYIEKINDLIYGYDYDFNLKRISILRKGVLLGELNKGIFKPSFNLAHYLPSSFSISLNEEEFKKYIKGETIQKQLTIKNGYYVISYNSINLGFIKYINGTMKNLYPKGLRH